MEDWVVLNDSDGDSVELHDGSDVGSDNDDSESSFAVVQVRSRAAAAVAAVTPAVLPQTVAVEAVPVASPPGFFKAVSYREAFSGIASEHVAAASHAPEHDAAKCSDIVAGGNKEDVASSDDKEDIAHVSPVIVGSEHENAEISDVAESEHEHVDSKIAAKDTAFSSDEDLDDETDDDDIECFDEEDKICEENPDDDDTDDEESDSDEDTQSTDEESDYEEDTTDLESDSDEDSESTDEESDYEEENDDEEIHNESGEEDMNSDDKLMGLASGLFGDDDSSFHDEEDLDDDDDDDGGDGDESVDDDDIECYDVEDIICEENPDDEIFDEEEDIDFDLEDMKLDDVLMGLASGLFGDDDTESFHDEEDLDDDDDGDESLDDDDIECYDVEDKISEENPDDEIFDDEENIDCEEDLDDDDEIAVDDDIECYDIEDIICHEIFDESSSEQESDDNEELENSYDDEEESDSEEQSYDEEDSDCEEEIDDEEERDGEEEQPDFDGGNKYDAIDYQSLEESVCMEKSDAEEEWPKFAGVPVTYDDIDTESSDMEIDGGSEVEYPEFNGGMYDDIDSESFDEEEPEEFAGGGYDDIDYESLNGEESVLEVVLSGGDIDNESFDGEESFLDDEVLDFFYGATLYDYETESYCDEECERVCVCGRCMELIDGEKFYQLTGDGFDAMQLGSATAIGADEEEPSDAGESDDDTAHEANRTHGDSSDMAGGNSAATMYRETLCALYAAAAAEPAVTPSQFQQAMEVQVQHAVARDQAAAAMVRAADAIDSYMQAAAGLAAQDVEALSQGATSLRAMAAAPSFVVGVGASKAAAPSVGHERACPHPHHDQLALQDMVVALVAFYLLFGVVSLLLRTCAI